MKVPPDPSVAEPPAGVRRHRRQAVPALGWGLVVATDQRTETSDETTPRVRRALEGAGHRLLAALRVGNRADEIAGALDGLVASVEIDAVLFSGGTGFSPRDLTVDTLEPRFDRRIDGFGEILRALSFAEIGAAAMLSRATAGMVAGRPVFLLPGSPHAVALALERLILPEAGHLVAQVRRQG